MTAHVFNKKDAGLLVAAVFFAIIALSHLVRVIAGLQIVFGSVTIPVSASVIGMVVMAALSFWLWTLTRP